MVRNFFKRAHWRVVLAVTTLTTALSAGVLPVPASAADGQGPVITGLQFPTANVWLGTHLWQSDDAAGFCRVDNGALKMQTCVTDALAPGQVAVDSRPRVAPDDGSRWVYVSDTSNKSVGVHRYIWNPTTETLGTHVLLKNTGMIQQRLTGTVLGSDGNLYISSIKSQIIWRINNPHLAPNDPLQTVENVGFTARGRGIPGGLAIINRPPDAAGRVGSDLYIAETTAVTVIDDIASCSAQNFCIARNVPITVVGPTSITSDRSDYLYVADTPEASPGSILRYNPWTNISDVYSTKHPTVVLPSGEQRTRYMFVPPGMSLGPTGDLFVPTGWYLKAPGGEVWRIPGGSAPDVAGQPGRPAFVPVDPGLVNATLKSWGQTAADGGVVWLPGALGGHWWGGDHAQGFCRLDAVPGTTLLAINTDVCDDETMGSPGPAVYDSRENVGIAGVPDGTHFVYVAQNDTKSHGIWRFVFDPATERLVGRPEVMAPGRLQGIRNNSLALGPDGHLYVAGIKSNQLYRIRDPRNTPRFQPVDKIAQTHFGKGILGTIGFIGNDLYLPEGKEVTVIKGVVNCPTVVTPETATSPAVTVPCVPEQLPITTVSATGVATDPARGFVYIADSPDPAPATILRWDVNRKEVKAYTTVADLPAATTPEGKIWCSLTCTHSANVKDAMGAPNFYHFVFGMVVEPLTGDLYITDDPAAGIRAGRGHLYQVPLSKVAGADKVLTVTDENAGTLVAGDYVTVTLAYTALNTNPNLAETATVTVITSSEPNGISLTLTESGANSGTFTGRFQLAPATNTAGTPPQIKAAANDTVRVVYPTLPAPVELQATATVAP